MRPLTIITLICVCVLMSACHTTKHSSRESTEALSVELEECESIAAIAEMLTVDNREREVELSGVKIEFSPADTALPECSARPISVSIERVHAKERRQAEEHYAEAVTKTDTTTVTARRHRESTSGTWSESKPSNPLPLLLIGVFVVLMGYCTIKYGS